MRKNQSPPRRKTKTRRVLLSQLPKNVGIPKFFSPTDISNLIKQRKIDPHISWEESINRVVFESIPDLRTVLAR
jgi:hypothetical protein